MGDNHHFSIYQGNWNRCALFKRYVARQALFVRQIFQLWDNFSMFRGETVSLLRFANITVTTTYQIDWIFLIFPIEITF